MVTSETLIISENTALPLTVSKHQSYDYFAFTKMDPKNKADQKLAEEYWLNLKEGEIV